MSRRLLALAATLLIAFQVYVFASKFFIDESVLDIIGQKKRVSGLHLAPDSRRPHRSADLFRVHLPNRVALARYQAKDIVPPRHFIGEWETAALYPVNGLYAVLSLRWALRLEVLFHLALAALGVFLLCRSAGASLFAAGLGGACFLFSGQVYGRIYPGHLSNLAAIAWIPLTLYAARRSPVFFGVTLAYLILSGHPQYLYFTALVFAALAVLGWFPLKTLPALALAAGVAVFLSWPQVFPALEAYRGSARVSLPHSFSASFHTPPKAWVTVFDPYFFGAFGKFRYWPKDSHGINEWEASLFFGGLGAVGLMVRGLNWRLGLALAVTTLLALGASTPLYNFLHHYLPAFKSFRGLCKFSVFTMLFASLAVARGFDLLWRSSPPPGKLEVQTFPAIPSKGVDP